MIRRTFLILPSVGLKTEAGLWKKGIEDWDSFLDAPRLPGFSEPRKAKLDEHLVRAMRFLQSDRTDYFSKILPSPEHWRIFGQFKDDAAYLDIETDGQGPYANVTVVGIYRNGKMTSLVRGRDLNAENLGLALNGCKVMVTFNGGSFDLPILEYHFPLVLPRIPHFDLRTGCGRMGLVGGLKSIEKQMGMQRAREIEYVTGEEAVYLWRAWERSGKENALRLLRRYNEEDTKNLQPLAEHVYETLKNRLVNGSKEE
jgi:uncharacterized protein